MGSHQMMGDAFDIAMVLFDNIIQIFTLPYFNARIVLLIGSLNASFIRTAFIDIN